MAAGLMDTNRDKSRYARLFLKGKTGAGASLKANHTPLLVACKPTEEGFSATVAAAKIDNNKLDLANVTAMYHISAFCHIPAVESAHFEALQALWIRTIPLFNFRFLTGNDEALRARNVDSELLPQQAACAAWEIMVNIQSSKEVLPAVDKDNTTPSPCDAAAALAELFDPLTAQLTTAFIERPLQTRLASDTVLESLTSLFPDSNTAVLSPLLRTVRGPESQDKFPTRKPILDILRVLAASNEAALGKDSSDVFFSLTSADLYRFYCQSSLGIQHQGGLRRQRPHFRQGAGGWTPNKLRL
ncbi:uncharacterized protein ATNIH1004_005303 [Aspergillus tanneri]|uniref:Uncharacterized protein n=1 Tax=Aspergillus tanneri TaxID=1220188 RepID=A0A5M9MQL1_9EURO|nr:uncharacterized protein ATNIH1004_005303 [Aspergillus tanneri]KAA8649402.1 hypothetical protein ATNIH1004_005303 [Aspergillus tanneri]